MWKIRDNYIAIPRLQRVSSALVRVSGYHLVKSPHRHTEPGPSWTTNQPSSSLKILAKTPSEPPVPYLICVVNAYPTTPPWFPTIKAMTGNQVTMRCKWVKGNWVSSATLGAGRVYFRWTSDCVYGTVSTPKRRNFQNALRKAFRYNQLITQPTTRMLKRPRAGPRRHQNDTHEAGAIWSP